MELIDWPTISAGISFTSMMLYSVGGFIGNRTDATLCRVIRTVIERWKGCGPLEGREIQKSTRKAYLQATISVCEARLRELGYLMGAAHLDFKQIKDKSIEQEVRWINRVREDLAKDKDQATTTRNITWGEELEERVEWLLTPALGRTAEAHGELARSELKAYVVKELEDRFAPVPPGIQDMIINGWSVDEQGVRLKRDWFDTMCSYFVHDMKTNEELARVIDNQLLSKLVVRTSTKQQEQVELTEVVHQRLEQIGEELLRKMDVIQVRVDEQTRRYSQGVEQILAQQGEFHTAVMQRLDEIIPTAVFGDREQQQLLTNFITEQLAAFVEKSERILKEETRIARMLVVQEQRRQDRRAQTVVGLRLKSAGDTFKNRNGELQSLRAMLQSTNTSLISITGRGGMGKTVLLSKVCGEIERGELKLSKSESAEVGVDGIIYISYKDEAPSLGRIFEAVEEMLGSPKAERLLQTWQHPMLSLEAKAAFLLSELQDGYYLLILDNLESALDDNNEFIDQGMKVFIERLLDRQHGMRLVSTSRRPIRIKAGVMAVRELKLRTGLDIPEAVELLYDLDPDGSKRIKSEDAEILHELARRCEGIPRALELVAGLMANDDRLTISKLLANRNLFGKNIVEELIDYHYDRVDEEQQTVLQALSVFNEPVPKVALDHLLLATHPHLDVEDALEKLVRNYFVTCLTTDPELYDLHPLDHEHAYAELETQDGIKGTTRRGQWHRRAAEFYFNRARLQSANRPVEERPQWHMAVQVQWAEAIGRAVEHLFAAEAWQEIASHDLLMQQFYVARFDWGYLEEGIERCEGFLTAAKQVDNQEVQVRWIHHLAVANYRLGRFDEAISLCEKGLELCDAWGHQTLLKAHLLHRYGVVMQLRGELERARDLFKRSEQVKIEVGDAREAADTRSRYMDTLEDEGKLEEVYDEQVQLLQKGIDKGLHKGGYAYRWRIVRLLRKMGRYDEALAECLPAVEMAEGEQNLLNVTRLLEEAGKIFLALSNFSAATKALEKSLSISKETKSYNETAEALRSIAALKHMTGDLEAAAVACEEAITFGLVPSRYQCLVRLGLIKIAQGSKENGQAPLREAVIICNDLLERTQQLYDARYKLALAELAIGETDLALDNFRLALETCSGRGVIEAELNDLELLRRADKDTVKGLDEAIKLLIS